MLVSQEVRRGAQGASCVAPGKLGLDACGEGVMVPDGYVTGKAHWDTGKNKVESR